MVLFGVVNPGEAFLEQFKDPKDGDFDLSYYLAEKKGVLVIPIPITEPAVGLLSPDRECLGKVPVEPASTDVGYSWLTFSIAIISNRQSSVSFFLLGGSQKYEEDTVISCGRSLSLKPIMHLRTMKLDALVKSLQSGRCERSEAISYFVSV